MTFRVYIGIDPGQSGAIATVADGQFDRFMDMPITGRAAGGNEVCAAQLAAMLRGLQQQHHGAVLMAVLEQVSAMPGQGVSSMFRFGESFGVVKGVLGSLALPYRLVAPQTWKKRMGLTGAAKDVARTVALQRFPTAADGLTRKKDIGRADALLIAGWADETEQAARAA